MQINLLIPGNAELSAKEIMSRILVSRGYNNEAAQREFLYPVKPDLASLVHDTKLSSKVLGNIQKLIDKHIEAGHDICVFGDYDADGISATAILWQALIKYTHGKSVRILPFLPDRHRHGYGLSIKAINEIVSGEAFKTTRFSNFSPKLIITVDNGIVAHEAAMFLHDQKIDLIITDHHEPSDVLPQAKVILHTTGTSGAGIAWILALSLLKEDDFAYKLADIATIGVVADMMPLQGHNRRLVVYGLQELARTDRPGIIALYDVATLDPKSISTYTINFALAPRINAAGRLYDPYDALRLLCATSASTAMPLAKKINEYNEDRQELTEIALNAVAKASFTHKIVVVSGEYHEGIIGLIAGKLTELTHKPAIVMSQKDGSLKASARSVSGVNITELLRTLTVPFLSLGGHSQAAGFSLATENKARFLEELYQLADETILDQLLEPRINVDFELTPLQVSLELAKLMSKLEPFGIGNPKPKFLLKNLSVLEDRELGTSGKHRKLMIESGRGTLPVLLFNTTEPYPLKKLDTLVATIDVNVWKERETVQLIASYVEH